MLSTQPNILGTEYLVFLVLFVCFHGSGARCPTALIWDAGGEHVESAESSFLVGYEVYFSCGGIGAQAEITEAALALAAAEVDASATEGVPFLVLFCSSGLSGLIAVQRTS